MINPNTALLRAIIELNLMPNNAFVTTLGFTFPTVWDEDIPTACVTPKDIRINPKYFVSLPDKQRATLLAHEIWHIAFDHLIRSTGLDPERFNAAADYVINETLVKQGFEPIPGWLHDKQYYGMSTQEVYNLLESQEQNGAPSAQASNSLGNDIQPVNGADPDANEQEENLRSNIIRANTAELFDMSANGLMDMNDGASGKAAGSLPGGVQAIIEAYLNPILPWEKILDNYMDEYDKDDYSWKRPNKRYMPDIILPSLYSESLAEIALAFDTSCSVSDDELRRYCGEVQYIVDRLEPNRVTVASFDHELQNVDILEKGDPVSNVKLIGRGGTDLAPMMEYYRENPPNVLIVFSDLECYPTPLEDKPDFDVIWVCVGNEDANVNFGKLIHVPLEALKDD